jgi:hypothetical protein
MSILLVSLGANLPEKKAALHEKRAEAFAPALKVYPWGGSPNWLDYDALQHAMVQCKKCVKHEILVDGRRSPLVPGGAGRLERRHERPVCRDCHHSRL